MSPPQPFSADSCTCTPDDTLLDAALLMAGRRAACVLVIDGASLVGVATEDDVWRGAHASGVGASIASVMRRA
jgi:CBS domain-containing protein